jgi:hypothetical protein
VNPPLIPEVLAGVNLTASFTASVTGVPLPDWLSVAGLLKLLDVGVLI